ncbi:MAG: helix-turn-helix transcriptional regulator [Alicyclobacillus macrosporangiidus]|uniref:helix-turn-helix transcriptional regulator n=1 Tax=Alicyclobacillus macrosporangiidus TaxID=392015 RepID=UPI0026EBAC52|nr:helix-turn-helix transcriptional regulator [Alicyclobacillus macrosporangiidus]MCL6598916.1 helix-turn-helix transcriptional regulator [Alicyclobacillus macrosporangiidus]
MDIGNKIRNRRKELGLTQAQLAGNDINRSLISQIESGRCLPSLDTLKIISQRLDKPIAYFLNEDSFDDAASTLISMSETALQSGNTEEAIMKAKQAVSLSSLSGNTSIEARSYLALGLSLIKAYRLTEAVENLERALTYFTLNGDTKDIPICLLNLGHCYYMMEEFSKAKTIYQRSLQHTSFRKTNLALHAETLVFLGSTLVRLGDLPEALGVFQSALSELRFLYEPKLMINAYLGTGWCYYKLQKIDDAIKISNEAIKLSQANNQYRLTELRHNLGIYLSAKGNWEEAYSLWTACLHYYQDCGNTMLQASILEEMARYWIQRRDLTRARDICRSALECLGDNECYLQRGRLYRLLAVIEASGENAQSKHELLTLAIGYFRRVQAAGEIALTLKYADGEFPEREL